MKIKYVLITLFTLAFWGCDDNTAGLGLGMFPGSDQNIKGNLSTFDVTTKSIPTGQIYARTNIGYVGKYTDETFGSYEAGFLTALNCPEQMTFPGVYDGNALNDKGNAYNVMVKDASDDIQLIEDNGEVVGNIYTVELYLWYESYFGDSVNACRLSVYELDQKLDEDRKYYTDINPEEFCDINAPDNLLGSKVYTAVDYSISDSTRNLDSYVPYVHIELDKNTAYKVGGEILKAARRAPLNSDGSSSFDFDQFSDVFPGVYVKSDYGDGTILYVFQVQMNVVYKCYAVDETTGEKLKKNNSSADSTYYGYRSFASTREVVQANQLINDENKINELINEETNTYIKSPAVIFTEATLPVNEIKEELQYDSLNAVKLTFSNYNQESDREFGMSIPSTLMLIRKKYKNTFFENNQLTDNVTSYLTSHSSTTNQYTFSNITNLINDCYAERENVRKQLEDGNAVTVDVTDENGITTSTTVNSIEEWEEKSEWDKIVLIPVVVTYDSSSSTSSSSQIISVRHDLQPGYVRLKGGSRGETDSQYRLKLEVVSTSFDNY